MRTIHKYKFSQTAEPLVLPAGKVLMVDYQGDGSEVPTVWVECDDISADTQELVFIGTGHRVTSDLIEHVGSAICGRFVWHVYRSES